MAKKDPHLIQRFEELYPGAATPKTPTKPFTTVSPFPRKPYTPDYQTTTPQEPAPPQPLPPPPPLLINYQPEFKEITDQEARDTLESNNFTGFDPVSVRKLLIRSPRVLLTALQQKWSDVLLYPWRAGWTEFTSQERNAMPWLSAALDWGISSIEMYDNAHALPHDHPLKNICLTAAKQMREWEQNHPRFSGLAAESKPLDQLLGQPILIGSDGWPLNKLDDDGLPLPEEELYSNTYLLYRRYRPHISKRLQKLFRKIARVALEKGRIILIQP